MGFKPDRNRPRGMHIVIDIDDYEACHASEIQNAIKKCIAIDGRFKLNVFAIPGMMKAEQIIEMLAVEGLIPCLHGFFHRQGECLTWTKDMAVAALLWAERAGFHKVFRAPYWQMSDGLYEALADRKWIIADHPNNKETLVRFGCIRNGYFHNHDLETVAKMSEADIWWMKDPLKIHGHIKQIACLEKFVKKLSSIELINPTFLSITKFMRSVRCQY